MKEKCGVLRFHYEKLRFQFNLKILKQEKILYQIELNDLQRSLNVLYKKNAKYDYSLLNGEQKHKTDAKIIVMHILR